MSKIWEKKYHLRAGDFDRYNRLQPAAVLDLFQDAAGQHGEELGVGYTAMLERSYLWVMVRVRFRILAQVHRYQTVNVKTWPLEPHRLNYRREYCIEDQEGNPLIIGSSEWVVMHSEKRRLLAVPNLYSIHEGFHTELMFDKKSERLQDFSWEGEPYVVNAAFSELDVNGHVNNIKYANYVMDAIDPPQEVVLESVQIDYRKEVVQGTQLNIRYQRSDGVVLAKGLNNAGDTMFNCKITFLY